MTQPGSAQPDPDDEVFRKNAPGRSGIWGSLGSKSAWLVVLAGGVLLAAVAGLVMAQGGKAAAPATPQAVPVPSHLFPVTVNRHPGTRMVATSATNFQGQPVMVSCSSCHATTKPNLENREAQDLDQFHQGLQINHGNLNCLSCHNSSDYERLRLADGRGLDFVDSMTLCSQCHGPQRRDYDMGLHGGMSGHWDLTRGGRSRNTCVDCHDPHSPAFPAVMPVLPPRDRISVQGQPEHRTPGNLHP